MKKLLLSVILFAASSATVYSQCNTSNASTCSCDSGGTNCDLLPDITISWYALQNYMSGPSEYAQTGNGVNNGRLRITGSTPNIGHGPLTVQGTTYYTCGTDTFATNPGNCPDGALPKHLIKQRIYHKNGNAMSYNDRWAGSMTYHPTHGHDHVDDWDVVTLRLQDPAESDPRNWPIVGTGSKLGFCLMDYYKCSSASGNGHCRDTNMYVGQGTVLNNVSDFPNDNLGGGSYACSQVQMGISSGWTDVYDETLDGMWINIPPGTCNGNYWIVSEVDKPNHFIEEDETNNWTAIPFTLTQQMPGNSGGAMKITPSKTNGKFCAGDSIQLTADAATNYLWSNSATTQSIWVTTPGNFTVIGTNYCGTLVSAPFKVSVIPVPSAPTVTGDTICYSGNATLNASGSGNILWYNNSGQYVGSGNTFITPTLTTTTTYWAENAEYFLDTAKVGPVDTLNTPGGYATSVNGLVFNVYNAMNLISVKVFANAAGNRTFEVRDSVGGLVQTGTFNLPAGQSRVTLNWTVPQGNGYTIKCIGAPDMFRASQTNEIFYPYDIANTVSIVNSTVTGTNANQYYYYFYDWEVEHSTRSCNSGAVSVDAFVNPCIGIASVKDQSNNIKIYPNPAKDLLNVEMNLPGNANSVLTIYDVLGQSVYTENLGTFSGTQTKQVNISALKPAVYFVTISLGGKVYHKRLVKE
ncbi:MAG: T9SS type A sorting domain-containing protein [Bacteroidia bacterium]|nr:T9SS type A sorting domain-containing protein [Bacteroidia bacterium]